MSRQEQIEVCLQNARELIGIEEFEETLKSLENYRINKERYVINHVSLPNYIWVFERGGGVSTCLDIFSKYLFEAKIMEFKGKIKYFEFIPNYVLPDFPNTEITDIDNIISDNAGHHLYFRGIACIILDNWIGKTHEEHFLKLLDYLENKNDKILSIFCVHTDDKRQIEEIESSISSYLWYETVRFRFPNCQELIEYLEKKFLHNTKFYLTKNAKDLLSDTLNDIIAGENFNGFVTINQLGNDILFKIMSSSAEHQIVTDNGIAKIELNAELLSYFHKNSSYIQSLKKISKSNKSIGFITDMEK